MGWLEDSARRWEEPIRVGVSSCLLGNEVRFDGGHKRDAFLVESVGRYIEWVPVCPEVEVGMGTPRPTLRLERRDGETRLIAPSTGADYTAAMHTYARKRVAALAEDDLCGYILKKNSPSCGMERVKLYAKDAVLSRSGVGLFAEALMERFPSLPVEEEGRLNDPRLRENFVERVFAYRRVRSLFAANWRMRDLVEFHTAHKLQLMAHSPQRYRELGRLVANPDGLPRKDLRGLYEGAFMQALAVMATRRRHTNVLQHMTGYFKKLLDDDSRRELLAVIEDYRAGLVPLIVPITLVRHHVRRFDVSYLAGQVYLDPHPKELMLRNHV